MTQMWGCRLQTFPYLFKISLQGKIKQISLSERNHAMLSKQECSLASSLLPLSFMPKGYVQNAGRPLLSHTASINWCFMRKYQRRNWGPMERTIHWQFLAMKSTSKKVSGVLSAGIQRGKTHTTSMNVVHSPWAHWPLM